MKALILVFLFIFGTQAQAQLSCSKVFATADVERTIESLAKLRLKLDVAQAQGVSGPQFTTLKSDYKLKEKFLISFVEENKLMSRQTFMQKMKLAIEKMQNNETKDTGEKKAEQEEQIRQTKPDGRRISLQKINPGEFMRGSTADRFEAEITKPYEVSATKVTQFVWKKIVLAAHAKLGEKYEPLDPDPSLFKGDLLPVEAIRFDRILLWFEALEELSKLGDPVVTEIIPDHKKNDLYRLPTDAEWEFMATNRGRATGRYYFGDDEVLLQSHAWYNVNSGGKTHPVAELSPLVVDGSVFYDVYGNAAECVGDRHVPEFLEKKFQSGKDPFYKGQSGDTRIIRGSGPFHSARTAITLRKSYRTWDSIDSGSPTSFRIVRIRPTE